MRPQPGRPDRQESVLHTAPSIGGGPSIAPSEVDPARVSVGGFQRPHLVRCTQSTKRRPSRVVSRFSGSTSLRTLRFGTDVFAEFDDCFVGNPVKLSVVL